MFVSARISIAPYMPPGIRAQIFALKKDANIATKVQDQHVFSRRDGRRGGIEFTGATCQQSLALTE